MLRIEINGKIKFFNSLNTGKGDRKMRKMARDFILSCGGSEADFKKFGVDIKINEIVISSHNC